MNNIQLTDGLNEWTNNLLVDWITIKNELFGAVAVCYRESNEEDLEAFAREVEEAGRMNEERREMFKQLENLQSPPKQDGDQLHVSILIQTL